MSLPVISPQLLNSIPEPVLVVDRSLNVVALANSPFIKLTAYTQTELSGMAIQNLVQDFENLDVFAGGDFQVSLSRRARSAIDSIMTITPADPTGQWLLLSFRQIQAASGSRTHSQIMSLLAEIVALTEDQDLNASLPKAASLIAQICDARFAGIYIAQSDQPRLKLVAMHPAVPEVQSDGNTEMSFLPELPASDLVRLDSPAIWVPGKRLQCDLYKSARVAGFSYLASTPVSFFDPAPSSDAVEGKMVPSPHGTIGLLVIADRERQPADNTLEILKLLGTQVCLIHDYHIIASGLKDQIQSMSQQLVFRNGQLEHQREGVLTISSDLNVLEINPAAEWMLGYTPNEVVGQPVQNILIGTKSIMPALQDAFLGIPTHNLSDVALHRRNGQSFSAQLRIFPVQDFQREKGPIGVLVFISDVSEHEQIQARTQQLEHRALLGEVIAVFAHEVRNPINNIATGLQLMETWLQPVESKMGEIIGEERQSQLVQRMLGDCQRLNHLMESVLQFSRPIEPKLEPVDLPVFLQRFLDRWRPRLARVDVTPFLSTEPQLPLVMADPRTLEQVFTNLISNAVHAMSSTGGTLAIRLFPNETIANFKQVEIAVSDTGPGIPEEFRSRLFEPFATASPGGTGLGLAITKRIVTAHRGSIWVESFPGGTVFHILLPASEGD